MACYAFGPFVLDSAARVLLRDDLPVEITAKIFETLLILVQNRGRVLEKDELLAALWPNTTVEEANLTQSISTLRKVLNDNPKAHRYVATIPGRGYSFVASVAERQDSKVSEPITNEPGPAALPPANSRPRVFRSQYLSGAVIALAAVAGWIGYLHFGQVPRGPVFYSSVPLTSNVGLEVCPSFSPEGDRVVFAWDGPGHDNFDIYVKQVGGGQPMRLTNSAGPDISPAWSPDGRMIAFLHVIGKGTAEVLLIPAIGPGTQRVLATVTVQPERYYRLRLISWSLDGKWLALSDAPDTTGVASLFLLSTETGEKRRVTFPPLDYDDFDPAFSPDMSRIAFVRYSSLGASASDLYILRLSADLRPQGTPERVTRFNRQIASPVWTPDGRTVLFARHETGGSHNIWRINITDHHQIDPLPIPVDNSSALAISRSGNRIVYTRDTSIENIWSVNLNSAQSNRSGGILPWITSTSRETNPQFSPDGQHVAYQSYRSGTPEIWVSDRDGSNARQLTSIGAIISGFPRWSPDGRKIVFHSRPKGSATLYTVDADGGRPTRLTGESGNDISPSWSHDGKWIYFASRRTGEPHIWRLPAGGGRASQLTKNEGYFPLESKDGRFLYFVTPKHSLWRLPLAGGPESEIFPDVGGEGSSYAPAKDGIYFISAKHSRKQELAFFSFTSGQIKTITTIPGSASLGMTLSPDERLILYGQTDRLDSNLMLVDQFH